MTSTFDRVATIIAETCDIPRETITPESHAIDDLGIDSLDFLDIAFAIDKAFGIKLPLEQWTQEVNDGKATTEQYFVLNNLCARIDDLVKAKHLGKKTGSGFYQWKEGKAQKGPAGAVDDALIERLIRPYCRFNRAFALLGDPERIGLVEPDISARIPGVVSFLGNIADLRSDDDRLSDSVHRSDAEHLVGVRSENLVPGLAADRRVDGAFPFMQVVHQFAG